MRFMPPIAGEAGFPEAMRPSVIWM